MYTSFLAKYLNPVYLQLRTMKTVMAKFVNESNVQLQAFLVDELAAALEEGLGEADVADALDGTSRGGKIPSHGLGVPPSSVASTWTVKGPPHKWRYCTLAENALNASSSSPTPARAKAENILRELQDTLFPSEAFRAWLTSVTRLIPLSCAVEARRFRPGLDYTLATSDEGESRLDIVLGLTPQVQLKKTEVENGNRHGKAKAKASENEDGNGDEDQPTGWQAGEWGGWEVRLGFPLALVETCFMFIPSLVLHGPTRWGRRPGSLSFWVKQKIAGKRSTRIERCVRLE